VHRLYTLEGLQVRMRVQRGPALAPERSGQYWAMDFVHHQLTSGRKFRVLMVIDK
jgi:putative transposase